MRFGVRLDERAQVRTWLTAAFVALLALLVVLGTGSYNNVQDIIEHGRLVRHTVEVQRTLEQIQESLSTAESQQRAYLITEDKSFLPGYEDRKKAVDDFLVYASKLVADNPAQVESVLKLQELVPLRFARLEAVVKDAEKNGFQHARGMINAKGPRLSAQVRQVIEEMLGRENQLLVLRDARRAESISRATITFSVSAALTLSLLGGLYLLIGKFLSDQVQARLLSEEHRKELQFQIQEKERAERELQRSNRELQDFAFVASHDLQEPLRKIQAFGDRLRSKNLDVLDETSLDYLQRMQNAAGRMQELINALLNLSRVTTKAQPFVKVNLQDTLNVVVEDLQRRIDDTQGKVVVGSLPTIQADSVQMRQLFQNLIGNALKFRAEDRPSRVEVHQGNSVDPDFVRIVVSDNGIGFEGRHAEKIFQVFQRLHGRGEYEGSGIGLAICRRIVDRHGGKIVADSVPGEGATFTIDLPMKQPEATT